MPCWWLLCAYEMVMMVVVVVVVVVLELWVLVLIEGVVAVLVVVVCLWDGGSVHLDLITDAFGCHQHMNDIYNM